MNATYFPRMAEELSLKPAQVRAAAELLAEGATIPFIARYRKEATGSLDEVALAAIRDRLEQWVELDKRREAILKSLSEREVLTDELKARIDQAPTLAALEDIYLPFRPKRRTKATVARERGLEPLARRLFEQNAENPILPEAEAQRYVDPSKEVVDAREALAGARDIIAEWVSEDAQARRLLRYLYQTRGMIISKVMSDKEEEGAKFKDYFEWEEPIAKAPSHRVLAMLRGENEGVLTLRVGPSEESALELLQSVFVKGATPASREVALAVKSGYKRLLAPSMETEIRGDMKARADRDAIEVFAANLRELLLAPPLGPKNVLALDPGFRTGCKLVCLDRQGKLLHHDVIYPHSGQAQAEQARMKLYNYVKTFHIEAIAVGNGTAGRETESFARSIDFSQAGRETPIPVILVNEAGASIYSASEVAREEFPDHDVTVRGAVSIGRRLIDPLAELVKIDPKSIGVGQYQHDVDQGALKRSLDDQVIHCVNAVGVDVNTAGKPLLTYVSGLGPVLAGNLVAYRNENGPFRSRAQLKNVPRLGPKAFEQAAGFLRIRDGDHPLDASAVHPESYSTVDAMARDLQCHVLDLMRDERFRRRIDLKRYVNDRVGMPTLRDILSELAKPGRDPRDAFEAFEFDARVSAIEDLEVGMELPGIVTNVTAFGAFVDVGVHQDGLIHVSQLADRFVKDPAEVVKVHQKVRVRVLDVDIPRKRIALSMRRS